MGRGLRDAQDPKTAPERLAALAESGDPAVKEAVARNPNTPREALYALGSEHPKALLENPALSLWLLEAPDFFSQMPGKVVIALLQTGGVPRGFLAVLAVHQDHRVRGDVAFFNATPVAVLIALSRDERAEVRREVAENRNAPVEVLEALAGDKETLVRGGVARNTSAPATALTALSRDERAEVRRDVAQNPSTPVEALRALSVDQDREIQSKAIGALWRQERAKKAPK
jgi:hypothetical protein